MLLIYTENTNNTRLCYVLDFILKESLDLHYLLTNDKEQFKQSNKIKICYASENIDSKALFIKKQGLLDKDAIIIPKNLQIHRWKHSTILFYNQPGKEMPFDIFSAVFFLISRMEEYVLKTAVDKHNRFDYSKSIAAKYGFLEEPIIDIWILHFKFLLEKVGGKAIPQNKAKILTTFDIDIINKFQYLPKYKVCFRKFYYLLKGQSKKLKQLKNIRKRKEIDSYEAIWEELNIKKDEKYLCFILLSKGHKFDTNVPLSKFDYLTWIRKNGKYFNFQIHPSYRGHYDFNAWKKEKDILEDFAEKTIQKSRFHFIKYEIHKDYNHLINLGIKEDFSMAYGNKNGYRASTARSFYWFDLIENKKTELKVHPFAFMDSAAYFHEKKSKKEVLIYLKKQLSYARQLEIPFISVWHNYLLADNEDYKNLFKSYQEEIKR